VVQIGAVFLFGDADMRINGINDVVNAIEGLVMSLINGASGIIAGLISLLVIWKLALMLWQAVKSPRTQPAIDPYFLAAVAGLIWVLK